VFFLGGAPGGHRISAVQPPRHQPEFLLDVVEFPQRNRQQALGAQRDAFFELELLLEVIAPQPERRFRALRQIVLQVVHVAGNRVGRLSGGIRQVAKDVQIVERGERPRQIGFDEFQRAPPGLEADLDEDPRAVANVVARRLHQPRRLPQLRNDTSCPLGFRGVGEQGLAGEAGAQGIGVDLRVALPRANRLELVHPGVDV
jgi:hypothetical protein